MNKRMAFAALVFFMVFPIALLGETFSVAVMDFVVVTENPQYRSLGKGFAELVSVQLSKVPGLALVDRERRNAVLDEQSFALSNAAAPSSAMEIGKLLSADFLVAGSVVDMMDGLVVSYELVSTRTGEVLGKDQSEGGPSDYKRIVREISAGLSRMAGKAGPAATIAAAPLRPAKEQATVLRKYSEAVDALDTRDNKKAEARIEEARALDPEDPSIAAFLAKLGLSGLRFQAEIDRYEPSYNPAILGFAETGSVFLWSSMAPPDPDSPFTNYSAGEYGGSYRPFCWRLGGNFPFASSAGISAEFFMNALMWSMDSSTIDLATQAPGCDHVYQELFDVGVQLGFGRRISPNLSVGGGFRLLYSDDYSDYRTGKAREIDPYSLFPDSTGLFLGATAGLFYKADPVAADLSFSWTNQSEIYVDVPEAGGVGTLMCGQAPLVVNLGGSCGFRNERIIASLRGKAQLFVDERSGGLYRLTPSLEWRPGRWLGLRGGYEAILLAVDGTSTFGSGFLGGLSLSLGKIDVNANIIYRMTEPIRMLPGETYETMFALIGFVWNGLGSRRR